MADSDRIVLQGIAPDLGLDSCNVVTTYYDTVALMPLTAPGESRQATVSAAEIRAFEGNLTLCRTGDKQACSTVLESPLLTGGRRAEIEAAAALPAASSDPVYLLFPFLCVMENGEPTLKPTSEPYHHEAIDYGPSQSYSMCSPDKGIWGASILPACQIIGLTSLRLVCKGGMASTAQLTLAGTTKRTKGARLDGDSVLIPFFNRWRKSDEPESFHRLPAGWGIVPLPSGSFSAKTLESLSGNDAIPVFGNPATTSPASYFLTLSNWSPLRQILALALFLAAAAIAGFGFELYPDSSYSPRRYLFWLWLIIAVIGIVSAVSVGNAIPLRMAAGKSWSIVKKMTKAPPYQK